MRRPLILLVAFGATAGTLLDALHTWSGTTEYTHPVALRAAWWVPVVFAFAYGVGGLAYALGYARMRRRAPIASPRALAGGLGVFTALYAASGFLPASNPVKLVVLAAGAAGLWAWLDRSAAGFALAAVAAVVGPLSESALTHAGAFRHLQPDFLGIPIWLPALYFAAAPSFGQIARAVMRRDARTRSRPAAP